MAMPARGCAGACARPVGGRGKMAELGKKYCVYCLAEVSSLRFRCTECADIELCPDCFSAGAEIGPHRRWHGYQLVDGGRFTLWGAEAEGGWSSREEQLLLDAIEQFGFGNWVRAAAGAPRAQGTPSLLGAAGARGSGGPPAGLRGGPAGLAAAGDVRRPDRGPRCHVPLCGHSPRPPRRCGDSGLPGWQEPAAPCRVGGLYMGDLREDCW